MFGLYWIALALVLTPYWLGLLFTYENGDFGAVPATGRISYAAPILRVDRHISGRFLCHSQSVHTIPNSFHFDTQNYPL